MLLLVAFGGMGHRAWADSVSVVSRVSVLGESGSARVLVLTENRGKVSVKDLRLRLEGGAYEQRTLVRPHLKPGEENRTLFDLPPVMGGTAFLVWTEFRDRQNIPVRLCDALVYGSKPKDPEALGLAAQDVSLHIRGRLPFTIHNSKDAPCPVTVRAITPGALAVLDEDMRFVLAPGSSQTGAFGLVNRYAQVGDAVNVRLIADYLSSDISFSTVAPARVVIASPAAYKKARGQVLWGMAGFFACAGFALGAFEWKGRKRS